MKYDDERFMKLCAYWKVDPTRWDAEMPGCWKEHLRRDKPTLAFWKSKGGTGPL